MQFEDGTILENVKAEDIFVTEASLAEKHPGSDGGHGAMKVDEDDDDKEKKEELEEGEGKHKNPFEKTKEKKKQKQKHVNPFEESEKRPDSPDLDGDGDTEEPIAQAAKQADDGDDKEKNESWTRKNKDQLLFERLTKLWTK
jgi:Mg-chelatase subunit ChlI